MRTIQLVVTDLDNTLWDWFHSWNAGFTALLEGLLQQTGIPRFKIEREIREIHQRRGTSEYSWLVDELHCLAEAAEGEEPRKVFDSALHLQNAARKRETRLYDDVDDTLRRLRRAGVPIVGYTESQAFWTIWRMRQTGLDGVLDTLYSSLDHSVPEGIEPEAMRHYAKDAYELRETEHRFVPDGLRKPNPSILKRIVHDYGVPPSRVLYVGDSLMKDVAMAQAVGVADVHAKFGESHSKSEYDQLKRVSHWPDSDITNERAAANAVKATYVLEHGLGELFEHFRFQGIETARRTGATDGSEAIARS